MMLTLRPIQDYRLAPLCICPNKTALYYSKKKCKYSLTHITYV